MAAKQWLADRQAELLPVPYFHVVVFTLPGPIADIAYQNKAVVDDLLLKNRRRDPDHHRGRPQASRRPHRAHRRAAQLGIGTDPPSACPYHRTRRRLVARACPGAGRGPALDCRPTRFFLPVRVLSRLFRRLFLERLTAAYQAGRLQFFADQAAMAQPASFKARLAPLRKVKWVVYTKRPFGGPEAVLAYLSRYTHRIAIANSRLVAFDGERVTFKWKDYRAKADARYKLMTLDADEFIRRFLIHVLPDGFHRIRHYGLFANANRAANIALARRLLGVPDPAPLSADSDRADGGHDDEQRNICPCCGGRMVTVETFQPGCQPRLWPIPAIGFDSS